MPSSSVRGCLAFAIAALLAGHPRPAIAETVDLQLVLAADVSRSVDESEFQLQRQGYAAAFQDARVIRAIRSGKLGRIAVCYFEWSGVLAQQVVVDWTIVADDESAGAFADTLLKAPRSFAERTAIGAAIDFAMWQFSRSGHDSERRTIDVSGDGTNTNGREPMAARADAVAQGVTINGLVILSPEPMPWNPWHTHPPGGLAEYFRQNVVGGPGAFVMVVEDFNSFAFAISNKLIREIAQFVPPPNAMQYAPREAPSRRAREWSASAPPHRDARAHLQIAGQPNAEAGALWWMEASLGE